MKNTKTALITSALAMLLCVAMLVGTTFAWFTDTASTGVNKIQAGNLDIQILNEQDQEVSTLNWVTIGGKAQADILWEPGATYKLETFKIKNNGSLALKFKFEIVGLSGDAKLLEAIDFTYKDDQNQDFDMTQEITLNAGDATAPITITGKMKDTAGNEYQGLSLDSISITVVATQAAVEYDSFTNDYDKDALLPVGVNSTSELTAAVADAADGGTVLISGEIDLENSDFTIDKNVTLAFTEGSTLKNGTIKIAKDKDVTISNVKMEGVTSVYAVDDGTVKFKDCHFAVTPKKNIANNSRGTVLLGENQYKTLNIEIDNCVFDYVYDSSVAGGDLYTNAIFTWSSVKNCSITNSTFNGYGFVAVKLMNVAADANILFEGNTFNMCDASAANNWKNNAIQFIPQHDNACTVTVRNNVFTGAYEDGKYVFYSEKMSSGGASLANMTLIHSGNTINGVACTDDNFRK